MIVIRGNLWEIKVSKNRIMYVIMDQDGNVIKIGLGFLQPFANRGIKNMYNISKNEKTAWQTGGTGPPKKNI